MPVVLGVLAGGVAGVAGNIMSIRARAKVRDGIYDGKFDLHK